MKIKFSVLWNWFEQERDDAVCWVTRKASDPKALEAYRAGFEQGWGACRNTLSLHGYISIDERELNMTNALGYLALVVLVTVLAFKIMGPIGYDLNRQFGRIAVTLETATRGVR